VGKVAISTALPSEDARLTSVLLMMRSVSVITTQSCCSQQSLNIDYQQSAWSMWMTANSLRSTGHYSYMMLSTCSSVVDPFNTTAHEQLTDIDVMGHRQLWANVWDVGMCLMKKAFTSKLLGGQRVFSVLNPSDCQNASTQSHEWKQLQSIWQAFWSRTLSKHLVF